MSERNTLQQLRTLDSFFFKVRMWSTNYKRFLVLLIPFFLVFLFVIFKTSLYRAKSEGEFLAAKNAYLKWENSQELENSDFRTLKGLIKRHPELVAPYETLIIQKILALGKEKKAQPFIENLSKRIADSYYTQFSKTTFLITEGEFEKALQEAFSLKERMLSDKSFWEGQKTPHFGSILFAFNLLRIAILSQSLEKGEEELVAWKELKDYARWSSESDKMFVNLDRGAFDVLLKHFTDQNLSMKDYIKHREAKILLMKKENHS